MNLPIIKIQNTSLQKFIEYWSNLYYYANEKIYDDCINKCSYNKNDIRLLFKWKNGMNLSVKKQQALEEKVLSKIIIINKLKSQSSWDMHSINAEFKNVSFVWRIFLLHIIRPNEIPIYDQNVHRAFNFIQNKDFIDVSEAFKETAKESFYFNDYYPFINKIVGTTLRQIDQAFFTFGQFINNRNYLKIIQ
jgi:hypothetical protein